jgi:hypothetical protein
MKALAARISLSSISVGRVVIVAASFFQSP